MTDGVPEPVVFEPAGQRILPLLEKQTGYFWTGGAQGQLLIARCDRCYRYQHPPFERCAACGGEALTPAPVSGRGRVATFTINHERWTPGMAVPFVFAAVELAEQAALYIFSNILAPVDQVRIGMPVSVCFERHGEIFLPLFRPAVQ
ncbi:MAG TPA: OB-fold domain-containing protein [Steroidobacteraceae bacterium]|nr:OB-fold domain-containing protein [Steroidobacteraceae bacterium]